MENAIKSLLKNLNTIVNILQNKDNLSLWKLLWQPMLDIRNFSGFILGRASRCFEVFVASIPGNLTSLPSNETLSRVPRKLKTPSVWRILSNCRSNKTFILYAISKTVSDYLGKISLRFSLSTLFDLHLIDRHHWVRIHIDSRPKSYYLFFNLTWAQHLVNDIHR